MTTRSNILLVDDHPIVRQGIAQVLADAIAGVRITEAADGPAAIERLQGGGVHLIVLDLTLPGDSGLTLLRRFRREFSTIPVLILSMHPAEQFAARALQAGAAGYATKDMTAAEIAASVRRALDGVVQPPARRPNDVPADAPPHESLSDREYQVLRMMGSGRAVSQIATELGLSVKTVSTYRARILEKLGLRSTGELIHYAVSHRLVS